MKRVIASLLMLAVALTTAANPTISISSAKQQFPWSGTVDIAYTVTGVTNKAYAAVFVAKYNNSIVGAVTNVIDGTGKSATAVQSYAAQWVATSTDQRTVTITPYLLRLESGYRMTRASNTFSSPSGTTISGLTSDDVAVSFPLPFTFPFYGKQYTSAYVSSNGIINFGKSFTSCSPSASSLSNEVMIAVMWHDLKNGSVTYTRPTSDSVMIRWSSVYYSAGTAANLEATLYKSGKIVIALGSGNASGGLVGISSGAGSAVYDNKVGSSLASVQNYVFEPTQ